MHSPDSIQSLRAPFAPLLIKELSDIFAGRALWVLLLLLSPLVGYSFIQAAGLYGAASGSAAQFPEVARGLSPLDGVVVPTFGALYLADTLLFPFVAIRAISAEKENGGLKLLLQLPYGRTAILAAKLAAILIAWVLVLVPFLSALAIWLGLGGHLGLGETANVVLGHLLYVVVIAGIALFAASITDGSATAAIVTLAFTLGFWVLDFAAAGQGGLVQKIAALSLTAVLRGFEQGRFSFGTIAGTCTAAAGLVSLAGAWLHPGVDLRRKLMTSSVIVAATAAAIFASSQLAVYGDASEDRRNSFAASDAAVLAGLKKPLAITVNLSPQDPRYTDLERSILGKLQRTMSSVTISIASSASGQFATSDESYGLISYRYDGREATSRSTSPEEVLPLIYELAGVAPPASATGPDYPGYPFVATVRPAMIWFYFVLPLTVLVLWAVQMGVLRLSRNRLQRQ